MNNWFNTLKDSETNNNQPEKNIFISLLSNVLQGNNNGNENSDNYYQEGLTDKGLSTFHVRAGTPDPEEEEFIRRMKRKKKGKRR
ncbi:hypothetical protein [Dysgonomonas sp. ZJ709]|uniref:hypothetical protein n=1 Tax=Dysgonomonas sp. ZJ709 TaxID=2709797 RepID=UPI0013EE1FE5|nr:hypothetical protein [Dysgonomonas sp. ZJ709]